MTPQASTTCEPSEICRRMKQAREALDLSQEALAKAVGGSKRGIQDNETRNRVPGGEVICGLVRLGINSNWLLTGEGPMLRADLAPKSAPAPKINAEALAVMLEAARMAHPKADPARHAELAARFYALSVENGTVSETDIHPPGVADAA